MSRPAEGLDKRLLELAHKMGEQGYGIQEVTGVPAGTVDNVTRRLVREGRLFAGKRGHRTVRIFETKAWADDYASCAKRRKFVARTLSRSHANWAPDAKVVYPTNPDGSPAYKETIVKTQPPPAHVAIRTGTHSLY